MVGKEKQLYEILRRAAHLPKHMNLHQDRNNIVEFVLHGLAAPDCFNLTKVAYFVDNPDFDHFKGIVGHNRHEAYGDDHWQTPDHFSNHMQNKNFNQVVRSIALPSVGRNNKNPEIFCNELAYSLGIENSRFFSWPLRHANTGYVLFEHDTHHFHELLEEHLELGMHLLGFCPFF